MPPIDLKALREEAGIREGEVIVEAANGEIVMRPIRPLVMDIDPRKVKELLEEGTLRREAWEDDL